MNFYYESCGIYEDTDKSTTILAHSTDTWSLCNNVRSFKDNLMIKSDYKFDEWLLEDNRQMAHQGMLDECNDYQVYEADLEQAQEPLKPSIRPPAKED